ncbi:MAG: cell division protein ZipA [Kangiellaceae bacterium]|nr:cell division protein ZipA [Kangiellaceae bacterium]
MDLQLTLLLIIVSLIILGFIYFDAKRRSKVKREKVERKLYEQAMGDSKDRDGFDLDGIGQVRVVGLDSSVNENVETDQDVYQDNSDLTARDEQQVLRDVVDESISTVNTSQEHIEPTIDEPEVPVLDDALFEFNKDSLIKESAKKSESNNKKEPTIEQPEQTSLFDDGDKEDPEIQVEPELIFSIFVVSLQDKPFHGPELVQTLVEQGMRHGDMDIFHRHSQSTGRGPIQFSLANAFEPGIFDLDDIDNLHSKGLALFMTLPGPKKPLKAYELMIKTAKAITEQLGGYVLDSSKSNFSKQIEAHHIQQIQEFERKQLLHKN